MAFGDPAEDVDCAGHDVHVTPPATSLYVFTAHKVQLVLLLDGIVPALHMISLVILGQEYPVVQGRQFAPPICMYPGLQPVQLETYLAPTPDIELFGHTISDPPVQYPPAAQILHVLGSVMVPSVVYTPSMKSIALTTASGVNLRNRV